MNNQSYEFTDNQENLDEMEGKKIPQLLFNTIYMPVDILLFMK